jgi:hypothetical protein
LAVGVKTSRPALMSARLTLWPVVTATLFSLRAPAVGKVVIFTASRELPSASLKPKSAAAMTRAASSLRVRVLFVPDGASFTGVMLTPTSPSAPSLRK